MAPVTRRPRAGREARRAELRHRLLETTERLLAQGMNFTEISVERLITDVGIARSTFYAYFEDKGALLLDLTEQVTQEVESAAGGWYRLRPDASRSDLRRALGELMESYTKHRYMLSAVIEFAAYDPRTAAQFDAVMASRLAAMETSFQEQQRLGGLRDDVDVQMVTPWLGWMTERGLYQLLDDGEASIRRHLDGMTTVIWRTLYEGTR